MTPLRQRMLEDMQLRGLSARTRGCYLAAVRRVLQALREPVYRVCLTTIYAGGLRLLEGAQLQVTQVDGARLQLHIHGKGRRERALPLWNSTAAAIRAWLAVRGTRSVPELFVNARGGSMTRWGFAYVLRRHATTARRKCSSLSTKRLHPHVLRHTCAMMVLQATQDIRKVSLWLGHSQLTTTDI